MSRFFSGRHAALTAYVPGEQPKGQPFIKLNTNEAPFPPPPEVTAALGGAAKTLNLYSDPEGAKLREKLAGLHGVTPKNISLGNGSDETLAFIFLAFFDGVIFPDVTYGLYPVTASLFNIPYTEIPVDGALAVNVSDYLNAGKNIVLANPNAPTGLALTVGELELILQSNPERLVVIDEAYADFSRATAIPLTRKYDNLIVVRTYSKSRFMAGARLGYAVAAEPLIADLETIRYSFNPYNVNALTLLAGAAAVEGDAYYRENWEKIIAAREDAKPALRALGLEVTDSRANFLFARHPEIAGRTLYEQLRARGILVRSFKIPRIEDYLRITVGTDAQMASLVSALKDILEQEGHHAQK